MKEKDTNTLSFYDKNLINSPYQSIDNRKKHFITLPGFIAFLYYPGSYLFLFASITLFIFLGFYAEKVTKELSFDNQMLTAFVANLIAYRLISFGYAPVNSVIFIVIILLSLIAYYSFIKTINDLYQYNAK